MTSARGETFVYIGSFMAGDDFAIDSESGRLSLIGHVSTQGALPRTFDIDPLGKFLLAANERSGTVLTYHIDLRTGELSHTGAIAEMPRPACMTFVRPGASA